MSLPAEKVPNNLCKYIHRHCYQQRIQGYDYCIRHILYDKTAPFKQCTYVQQPSKRRCTNAAPKTGERREVLCPFHTTQSIMMIKEASTSRKKKKVKGPAPKILQSLEIYCKNKKHDASYNREIASAEKCAMAPSEVCPETLNPPNIFSTRKKEVMDAPFSMALGSVKEDDDDHRDWGIGSKDYLRYAGVLTAKEVVILARQKTERLKRLYYEELKRTYYRLKEVRREYLQEICKGRETSKSSGKHVHIAKKNNHLLESYHSPHRIDKVFRHRRVLRKRNDNMQSTKQPTCSFIQDETKCDQFAVACTSFCLNHLSSDPNICLFTKCAYAKCDRPVLPFGDNVCQLHLFDTLLPDSKEKGHSVSSTESTAEQEHFQSMDDIASLGLDVVTPGSLFGLDQFGEPGESTDTVLSEEQTDLMQIQPIILNPPSDILADTRKSDIEEEK